jgi:Asp-tRNA(Asn)/Glu-tRNA(Gln) amidotransferase A subunit family amidase
MTIGEQLLVVDGPMARRVADLRAALAVLAGHAGPAVGPVPANPPADRRAICTGIPFKVGTDLADGKVAGTIQQMRMAIAVNTLALPAVAVPVGVAGGLPQVM